MAEVRAYAAGVGVKPSTIVQKAGAGGGLTWARWERDESSPTQRTLDKIRTYMAKNPPPAGELGETTEAAA